MSSADRRQPSVVADDRLRLLLTYCHPALPLEGCVALTCKVVAGPSTAAVAELFRLPEGTMSGAGVRGLRRR
jgi:RNA polymerase sigma-70 factor, ECF subfamily